MTERKTTSRERADVLVVERGLAETRIQAQALILAGRVTTSTGRVEKAGVLLARDVPLSVSERPRFVSRGGEKLERALEAFVPLGLRVAGTTCVDVGASTGGFTDCLLQHGAQKVYAVDVGWGQLHAKLRSDDRVVVRERTNARELTAQSFDECIELCVVDASFIGIGKLVGAIASFLRPGCELVALVKPQFEVGRSEASRTRGVVRDPALRARAIEGATREIADGGFEILGGTDSPIAGPKGNLEYLVYARRRSS